VRVNTTLIDARDQTQLWTESFDRELAGVLALQHDVARGVAGSLALTLLPAEQTRLARARPVNPVAYEAYLRGVSHLERGAPANLDAALHYFELARENDPDYALAYVGIGDVWSARQQRGITSPSEAAPRLRAARARALELDDTLPEAHLGLAKQSTWTDWNWGVAEASFRRAIELNPNDARARARYSHYLHFMQRPDEAMSQIEAALELDPFNAEIHGFAGVAFSLARRYDEALAHARTALQIAPDRGEAVTVTVHALYHSGRYEEALAAERRLVAAARGDQELDEALALGYREAGYRGAMRRAADLLAARSLVTSVGQHRVAGLYLRAGAHERALDWLERAYDARDPNLPYISSGLERFDEVRSHPRFQALLQRMNLPPYGRQ
jgi:tetratricopeptide (TPR) repeat protein